MAVVGALVLAAGVGVAGCAAVAAGGGGARAAAGQVARPADAKLGAVPGQALAGNAAALGTVDLVALQGGVVGATAPVGAALRAGGGVGAAPPPVRVDQAPDPAPASGLAASGIPVTALTAYKTAAAREAKLNPACRLPWPLLAGIGRVESDHGRFAGAVLHSDGLSTPPVVGIPLNGNGTALIRDTDGGRLDGDRVYDRAVGPMQFIPSTWASWGVDGNHDGTKDPFNIFDAADAAADYLCAAGRDLSTYRGTVRAILSYNYSYEYVRLVMSLERLYASGAVGVTIPVLPTSPDRPRHGDHPTLPPVDPGHPRGVPSSSTPTPRPTPSTTSRGPSSSPAPTSSPPTSASSSASSGGSSSSSSSSSAPPPSDPGSTSAPPASSSAASSTAPSDPGSTTAADVASSDSAITSDAPGSASP
ncbi:MAG TPA: lytic murein transglycosylase [Jatrophihabitans sp.]|nr:lytic murein transglycosylase [Jatrophihabitans sp.]